MRASALVSEENLKNSTVFLRKSQGLYRGICKRSIHVTRRHPYGIAALLRGFKIVISTCLISSFMTQDPAAVDWSSQASVPKFNSYLT
jgi:hypothetical protein